VNAAQWASNRTAKCAIVIGDIKKLADP
jgi:hypothetical protein